MKPEPLRGKEQAIIGSPKRVFSKGFDTPCFHKEDIKSAVEWLKEKVILFDMKDKQEAYENNINQIIDQAFEDAVK